MNIVDASLAGYYPDDDDLWVVKEPFPRESVSEHPWFWRLVGSWVVRWKRYEESHQGLYDAKSRERGYPSSWWWRNVTSWFSCMVTPYDYFWKWMCPHCSYDCDWVLEDMESWNKPWGYYRTVTGGSYFTGEYTCHWFEGVVTCPRCMKEWDYGDSN